MPPSEEAYTPVYVVAGFLDAGKTTFLSRHLRPRLERGRRILCIQMEQGEEELSGGAVTSGPLTLLTFPMRELQSALSAVSERLYSHLLETDYDEIWVEWNGMLPLSALETLFPINPRVRSGTPGDLCRVRQILYLADAARVESLLGSTGAAMVEQAAESDLIILRNFESIQHFYRLKGLLRDLNPGVRVLPLRPARSIERALRRPPAPAGLPLLLSTAVFIGAYFLLRSGMGLRGASPDNVVNIFLGIFLQAVPFLLIGVLLSSALQVFVSQRFFQKWFPKRPLPGILFALLAGFCLPVCDCASIPIFRGLIRKGVPPVSAVTFLCCAPVINPVVILSTWYAFSGNWPIVLTRVGLGILSSVLVGLSFLGVQGADLGKTDASSGLLCSCGCYLDDPFPGVRGRLLLWLRHAQAEFFSVGKFLLMGAFVSALFQSLFSGYSLTAKSDGLLLPLLLMMVMAFFLSLCSSSDAVVARSFAAQFPVGALMGFLVFGPMMDLKNLILLSGSLPKPMVLRLVATTFISCFLVVFLFFSFGLGGVLT